MTGENVDPSTVAGFGYEWRTFDQSPLSRQETEEIFQQYFRIFPWDELPPNPVGFDLGCGSGRWARCVAPHVRTLHCIDASSDAINVARSNLEGHKNCVFHVASVGEMPLPSESMDFGYSLGVLHHIPDTAAGLRACAQTLRPNAPLLVYLYYAFEQRPRWFRILWKASDAVRRVVSRLPERQKVWITYALAMFIYFPSARLSRLLEQWGLDVRAFPLSIYRERSFYTMRTDAFDRFSTRLEKRFTAREIHEIMKAAGLERITFSPDPPYWCAIGFRVA